MSPRWDVSASAQPVRLRFGQSITGSSAKIWRSALKATKRLRILQRCQETYRGRSISIFGGGGSGRDGVGPRVQDEGTVPFSRHLSWVTIGQLSGRSSIARSTYADPGYVHLMMRAREVSWPRLEASLGRTLITPSHACFLVQKAVDSGVFERAKAGEQGVGAFNAQSRQRYPQLRCKEHRSFLHCRMYQRSRDSHKRIIPCPSSSSFSKIIELGLGIDFRCHARQCSMPDIQPIGSSCPVAPGCPVWSQLVRDQRFTAKMLDTSGFEKRISLYPRNSPGSISERARTRFSMACLRMPIP